MMLPEGDAPDAVEVIGGRLGPGETIADAAGIGVATGLLLGLAGHLLGGLAPDVWTIVVMVWGAVAGMVVGAAAGVAWCAAGGRHSRRRPGDQGETLAPAHRGTGRGVPTAA